MSDNPRADIGNEIPLPDQPVFQKDYYNLVLFDNVNFYNYSLGQYGDSNFVPEKDQSYYFAPLADALKDELGEEEKPDFVSDFVWQTLRKGPSGFVNAVNSIMPKLIVPSELLVANGLTYDEAKDKIGESYIKYFNWNVKDASLSVSDEKWRWAERACKGDSYVCINSKDDKKAANYIMLSLESDEDNPKGDWVPEKLVVQGAFILVVKVIPLITGYVSPEDAKKNPWRVNISFGEVSMSLESTGAMLVEVKNQQTKCQLSAAQAAEVPPQTQQMRGSNTFVIAVYPVWNGLIVSNGVQDATSNVAVASQWCPKIPSASILYSEDTLGYNYSSKFDPSNPTEIVVSVGEGENSVKTDFGDKLQINMQNCRGSLCYLPLMFSKNLCFDNFFIGGKTKDPSETGEYGTTYDYNIYPIYTKNDTDFEFEDDVEVVSYDKPDLGEVQEFKKTEWKCKTEKFGRFGGQIFGYYMGTTEKQTLNISNGNGNFELEWEGGTAGDPSSTGNWIDYITNISVTHGLDGSNGSITVDKFGLAGSDSVAVQNIGAITIDMEGGPSGTHTGRIFSGIGYGIGEADSSDGNTWTIPLFGLEKKLEDIVLINGPFFDGWTVYDASKFFTDYGGIVIGEWFGNSTDKLPASTNILAPMMDFKSGTSILDCLAQVMQQSHYWYFIDKDGEARFYRLSRTDSLPETLGTDWSDEYSYLNTMDIDRTPDFEFLRNEIIMLGFEKLPEGTKYMDVPLIPMVESLVNETDPEIPWMKGYVEGVPGQITRTDLRSLAALRKADMTKYEYEGKISVPGNADILPYDTIGTYVVTSVTHNVDFVSKTWTTDLALASGRSS